MNFVEFILLIITSFMVGFFAFPYFIKEFKERGILVPSKKNGKELIPTNGGLVVIILYLILISIFSLFPIDFNFNAIIVLTFFAVFGLIYSLVRVAPIFRVILPLFFSLPLIPHLDSNLYLPLLGNYDLGPVYLFFMVPVFIMMTANLINFRADYNGMPSYTGLIILASIVAISINQNQVDRVAFIIPFLGVLLAFSYYNFFPAKIFEGHIGIVLGGAIGIAAVLLKLEAIVLIMIIPHLINFLLFVYYRVKSVPDILFPELLEDGTLKVYGPLTLKWVFPYYFKMNEMQSIFTMLIITAVFCTIAILMAGYV